MCWTTAGGAPPHQRGLKPGKGQRLQGWKGGQTSLMEEILELQERSGIQDTPESWLSWQGHTYNRVTITFFNTFSNIYLCYIYIYRAIQRRPRLRQFQPPRRLLSTRPILIPRLLTPTIASTETCCRIPRAQFHKTCRRCLRTRLPCRQCPVPVR